MYNSIPVVRVRTVLFFALIIALVHGGARALYAETVRAGDVTVNTPDYSSVKSRFIPSYGVYSYTVSWQGIPAASASIAVSPKTSEELSVSSLVKTHKFIDLFYKVRYKTAGTISRDTYEPKTLTIVQRENSRFKQSDVQFIDRHKVKTVNLKNERPPEEYTFTSRNNILEPLSASFQARSLEWPKGTVRDFDAFNGKSRYLVSLRSLGEETITWNGQEREVWVLKPRVWNLVKSSQNKKLREAWIYITRDEKREILRVKSEVFVGTVTAELDSFQPSQPTHVRAPGIVKAKLK